MANVEDAISAPVDLQDAVDRYQNVLQYAGSAVDFVFGIGLYMAPSNMLLHIGIIQGYNNEIIIAEEGQRLGMNTDVNLTPALPNTPPTPLSLEPQPAHHELDPPSANAPPPTSSTPPSAVSPVPVQDHEDEKTALVVGGVAIGLIALWFVSLRLG